MEGPGGFLQPFIGHALDWFYADSYWWTAFGLLGNVVFSLRFVVQWITSEKQRRLVVPPVFWHLSFWGSLITLIYAFHVDKLPIILGYIALPVIYGRNLALLRRSPVEAAEGERP
jgi:lipid-A-disaccharide synthase-like uncharacterized protein